VAINGFKVHGAVVLAVLGSGVGAAIAGAGSGGLVLASPQALRLIQQAPAALDSYPALSMTMTMSVSGNGRQGDVNMTGSGTPDGRTAVFTMSMPSLGTYVDMDQVGNRLYARRSGAQHWLACSINAAASTPSSTGTDGLSYLRLMAGATGTVRVVGHATIDRVKTTRYRVNVDIAQAAQTAAARGGTSLAQDKVDQLKQLGISTLPIDAWLDQQNALRQFALSMHFQGFSMSMKMRLRGSNTVPTVTAPSPADVTHVSSCQTLSEQLAR
jgi:hypothetical protein